MILSLSRKEVIPVSLPTQRASEGETRLRLIAGWHKYLLQGHLATIHTCASRYEEIFLPAKCRERREPNQSVIETTESCWLAKYSCKRCQVWQNLMIFSASWFLKTWLCCLVSYCVLWPLSSERRSGISVAGVLPEWLHCHTALTFPMFCHVNASCLFRASIAPGKCETMRKCRLLKRQRCVTLSCFTKYEGYHSDALRRGWGWAALCLWAFRGPLCTTG